MSLRNIQGCVVLWYYAGRKSGWNVWRYGRLNMVMCERWKGIFICKHTKERGMLVMVEMVAVKVVEAAVLMAMVMVIVEMVNRKLLMPALVMAVVVVADGSDDGSRNGGGSIRLW